jgi:predicted KAP-like P-loop ATPase
MSFKNHEYKHARNNIIGRTLGDFGFAGNVKNRIARLKIENVAKLKVSGGVWGRGHTHNPTNTSSYKKYRNAEHIANVEYKISKGKK